MNRAIGYQRRVQSLMKRWGEMVTFAAAGVIQAIPFVGASTLVAEYMGTNAGMNTIRPILMMVMSPLLPLPTVSDTFTVPEYPGRIFTVEYLAAETVAGVPVAVVLIAD